MEAHVDRGGWDLAGDGTCCAPLHYGPVLDSLEAIYYKIMVFNLSRFRIHWALGQQTWILNPKLKISILISHDSSSSQTHKI